MSLCFSSSPGLWPANELAKYDGFFGNVILTLHHINHLSWSHSGRVYSTKLWQNNAVDFSGNNRDAKRFQRTE
jgi:hypothetical protein